MFTAHTNVCKHSAGTQRKLTNTHAHTVNLIDCFLAMSIARLIHIERKSTSQRIVGRPPTRNVACDIEIELIDSWAAA